MNKYIFCILVFLFLSSCNEPSTTVEFSEEPVYTFSQLQSMPTARARLGAAVLNNKIYVPGGDTYPSTSSDKLEVYDISTDSWSTKQNLDSPMMFTRVFTYDNMIYIHSPFFYKFDPTQNTWTNVGTSIGGIASNPVGGKIYWYDQNNNIVELDLGTNTLTNCGSSCASFPAYVPSCPRGVSGVANSSSSVYFYMNECNGGSSFFEYNISQNIVTELASPIKYKYDISPVFHKNKIYIIGGTAGSVQSSIEVYDISANTWTEWGDFKYGGITEPAIVSDGDKIYIIGGFSGGGGVSNTLYSFNP